MSRLRDWAGKALTAPVRALWPKSPWLRLALVVVPCLLVVALLEPLLSLLGRGVDLVVRVLAPLLDNPVGRLLLLNVLLAGGLWLAWALLRGRIRALRSGLLLRWHLDGVAALVAGSPRARDWLRRAAASRAAPPRECAFVHQDAQLKLARLALDAGQADAALGTLTRVREKGLPRELLQSLLQLRARAQVVQGLVLGEPLERELRAGLERFRDDPVLLRLLREQLLARGALEEAAAVQERVVERAPKSRREAERERLAEDLLRAGEAALQRSDRKLAAQLAQAAGKAGASGAAGCLLGKVKRAEDNLRAAVKEWGATRSPAGLALIAELLEQEPAALGPRELLELSPTEGTLLLVAREYARAGELQKAMRAARRAARALGPGPWVTAVLAEVLTRCGRSSEAATLREEAALRWLAEGGA